MTNAQPEPSMEEILASIRRIISEDEEEGAAADETTSAISAVQEIETPQTPESVEATIVDVAEDVGEPLEEISDDPEPVAQDADNASMHLETEDVEMIKNNVAEAIQGDKPMLGENSAAAASAAFQNLSQSVRVSDGQGKTLEDIVTELLQPMVKEWLDANLPAIVEEKVEEEVQRVARRRS